MAGPSIVRTDLTVGTPIAVPFYNVTTGIGTGAQTYTMLVNGVLATAPGSFSTPTFAEIGSGLYTFTTTPSVTGLYSLFIVGSIQVVINVATRDFYTVLKNLEDEAIGSWTWDKVGGTLLLTRQDGSSLAGFSVVDNLTTANRQRTSP